MYARSPFYLWSLLINFQTYLTGESYAGQFIPYIGM